MIQPRFEEGDTVAVMSHKNGVPLNVFPQTTIVTREWFPDGHECIYDGQDAILDGGRWGYEVEADPGFWYPEVCLRKIGPDEYETQEQESKLAV